MRLSIVSIVFSLCFCGLASAQTKDSELQGQEDAILFGHNDAMFYGYSWSETPKGKIAAKRSKAVPDVYQVCGAYPALFSTDLEGIEQQGRTMYWSGVSYAQMRDAIIRHHRSGGLVTLSWHMRSPEDGKSYKYIKENHGTVGRILQRKGKTYDEFMRYLERGADFLLTLRDDEGQLIPVIFRPWHECNGNWFWWGTADCTAEQFVELWRLTHSYMQERGLTNLRYAFSPGSWFRDKAEYMQRFPGKEYVDVVGVECYRYDDKGVEEARETFRTHLQKNLGIAKAVADSLHVPYALTETGMQPNSDPKWWTLGLMPALKGYSPLFVNVWSNQCHMVVSSPNTWCTYPGEASAKDFRKFYKKNKRMFLKRLK